MAFDRIIGQDRPKRVLQLALQRGRLAHAYLFYGLEGVGKGAVALELAKAVNCERGGDEACDHCPSCRKVSGLKHPDLKLILPLPPGTSPERAGVLLSEWVEDPYGLSRPRLDGSISIEAVRELQLEGSLRPFEGRRKVVIILEADRMTVQAANALLKTLEEPPGEMLLILTSARPQTLLPTIISRCQLVRFEPLRPEEVERVLIRYLSIEPTQCQLAAHLAGGSCRRAGELLREDLAGLRDAALRLLQVALSNDPLEALNLVERLWQEGKRDRIRNILRMVLVWMGDLFRFLLSEDKGLVNMDCLKDIQSLARLWGSWQVEKGIELTEDALDRIERNVNPRLALTTFLFQLGDGGKIER